MTSSSPLVSVIIPTYNRADTLPRSINSVLNQTYSNIEVLVVDDGSTDNTETLVKSMNDTRVRYIKNPSNLGPSGARNRGVSMAKGELIAFQDSDDEWPADKLEKQLPLLLKDDAVRLVYCRSERYGASELPFIFPNPDLPLERKQGNIFSSLLLIPIMSTQTIVAYKDSFLEVGGFTECLWSSEDYEFSLRFARKFSIAFAENTYVKVYTLPDRVSSRYSDAIWAEFYIIEEMIEYYRQYDLLWKKLNFVQQMAVEYHCEDVFCQELQRISGLFLPEEQADYSALLSSGEEYLKQQNEMKQDIYAALTQIKEMLEKIRPLLAQTPAVWNPDIEAMVQAMLDTLRCCIELFKFRDPAFKQKLDVLSQKDLSVPDERLPLLTDMYDLTQSLDVEVSQMLSVCNICGQMRFG